jgi:aminocarboxymuconate-semialdehyde decarboxylase
LSAAAESIHGELPMLFTCRPPGTPIPGRFPGPAHARGKWFTVDIHCHIRSDKATAMVAGNQDVSRWFLETAANERSQRINRQNGERTHLQGMSAEQRVVDMDHMGIDIQAISPAPRQTYYGADPDLGLAVSRQINDEIAEMCGRYPDRFTGLGTVPLQAPELALAELDRVHKSLGFRGIESSDACRRRGSVGAALPADLRALRGAGFRRVHALRRLYRSRAIS